MCTSLELVLGRKLLDWKAHSSQVTAAICQPCDERVLEDIVCMVGREETFRPNDERKLPQCMQVWSEILMQECGAETSDRMLYPMRNGW